MLYSAPYKYKGICGLGVKFWQNSVKLSQNRKRISDFFFVSGSFDLIFQKQVGGAVPPAFEPVTSAP